MKKLLFVSIIVAAPVFGMEPTPASNAKPATRINTFVAPQAVALKAHAVPVPATATATNHAAEIKETSEVKNLRAYSIIGFLRAINDLTRPMSTITSVPIPCIIGEIPRHDTPILNSNREKEDNHATVTPPLNITSILSSQNQQFSQYETERSHTPVLVEMLVPANIETYNASPVAPQSPPPTASSARTYALVQVQPAVSKKATRPPTPKIPETPKGQILHTYAFNETDKKSLQLYIKTILQSTINPLADLDKLKCTITDRFYNDNRHIDPQAIYDYTNKTVDMDAAALNQSTPCGTCCVIS